MNKKYLTSSGIPKPIANISEIIITKIKRMSNPKNTNNAKLNPSASQSDINNSTP